MSSGTIYTILVLVIIFGGLGSFVASLICLLDRPRNMLFKLMLILSVSALVLAPCAIAANNIWERYLPVKTRCIVDHDKAACREMIVEYNETPPMSDIRVGIQTGE